MDGCMRTSPAGPVHLVQKLDQKPHHPLAADDPVRVRGWQTGAVGSLSQGGLEGGHAPFHKAVSKNTVVFGAVRVERWSAVEGATQRNATQGRAGQGRGVSHKLESGVRRKINFKC